MPILTPEEVEARRALGRPAHAPLPTTTSPSFTETIGAAFRQGNVLGSFAEWAADAMLPTDVFERRGMAEREAKGEVFDSFTRIKDTPYAAYAASFADADTPEQMYRTMARINRELADRETLDAAGGWGTAAYMLAAALDLPSLLPVGTVARGAALGARVVESAAKTGATGLASTALQEAGLQATQEIRPWEESAVNILAGGLLSAGAGALWPVIGAGARKLLGREAEMPPLDITAGRAAEGGSVGAKAVRDTTLEQETLEGSFGLDVLASGTSPLIRMLRSPLTESRRVVQDLVETPVLLEKHAEGIASPPAVETLVKMYDANRAQGVLAVDDAFVKYRMGRPEERFDRTKILFGDVTGTAEKLTRLQFSEEIGKAMRRNDTHGIPEVTQAAKDLRRIVFDPLKEKAIALELLPRDVDVKTADSYLLRLWNTDRIVANRDGFVGTVKNWLADEQRTKQGVQAEVRGFVERQKALAPDEVGQLKAIKEQIKDAISRWPGKSDTAEQILAAHTDLEDMELSSLANEITQRILSTPDGRLPYDVTVPGKGAAPQRGEADYGLRGPLRGRAFMIPDALVEPWLVNDAERIASVYVRTLAPDVELVSRFGDVAMTKQVKEITEGYARLIARATTEKERITLDKAMKRDIANLASMRDVLRGNYGLPRHPDGLAVRSFRVIRHINYLRMLGGMTINSIADTVRPVMVHGLMNYFGRGIAPLIHDMAGVKLAANEAKLAGTALDMVLSSRAAILGDIMDDYGKGTKLERGLFWASSKFGRITLMSQWNSAMKQFSGIIGQSRMLDAVTAGRMKSKDVQWLASIGIDRDIGARIATQFRTHGEAHDSGVLWANTQAWTDDGARQAFRAALVKDVDTTIVTPGIGDRPLAAHTELGKVVLQFRSFTLASMTRTALPALQRHDAAVLSGAIMSVALGMMGYVLYSIAARRELSDNPKKWIADGLERSGLFTWLGDATQLAGKATGYGVTSRFQSRGPWGTVLGPSFGTAEDMWNVLSALGHGDVQSSTVTALRRLLPYNNLFYLRWLFNTAEDGVDKALGIPLPKRGP